MNSLRGNDLECQAFDGYIYSRPGTCPVHAHQRKPSSAHPRLPPPQLRFPSLHHGTPCSPTSHSPAAACPSRPAPGLPCMVSAFRQEHCRLLRCRRSLPPCPFTGPCAAALGMDQETRNLTAFSTGPDKLKSSSGNHPSLASLGLDLSGSTGRPRSSGWWVSAQGPIGCNPD